MAGKDKKIKFGKPGKKGPARGQAGGQSKLTLKLTLILYALLPLLVASLTISIILIRESSSEITNYTHNSLVQVIEGVGNSFDSMANTNKAILKAYTAAPIIQETLKDPENAVLHKKAQDFTVPPLGFSFLFSALYISTFCLYQSIWF